MARGAGEGTVYKRTLTRKDGTTYIRWFARISAGFDAAGKRQRLDGPLREKKGEAQADLSQLRVQAERGTFSTRHDQTLQDYLTGWLEQIARRKKFRTYQTYYSDLNNHVIPELGHVRLNKLKRVDVQNLISGIHQQAIEAGRNGAAVARKARAALRTALQDAVDLELLERNPCERVKVPSEVVNEVELWTPEEAKDFLKAAKRYRIYPIVLTAITSGLRQNELTALRWDDLDTYPHPKTGDLVGQLHIRHSLTWVPKPHLRVAQANPKMKQLHGQFFLDTPKTFKSQGIVTIPHDTVAVILAQRAAQAQDKAQFAERYHDYGLIFPTRLGTPQRARNLERDLDKAIAVAGVKRIKFHDLRDTHATWLLIQGTDLGTVSDRLRHSTKSTTLNRYIQVLNARRRSAALSIDELFHDPETPAPPAELDVDLLTTFLLDQLNIPAEQAQTLIAFLKSKTGISP